MRVAVVAGPDPGHAIPALALCLRLRQAGEDPVLFTGTRWLDAARAAGLPARELRGLAADPATPDTDMGARIHQRAAAMSTAALHDIGKTLPDLVVSDVLTAGGGMAAERLGVPWAELSPHPLWRPSRGLPPIGSGLAPGAGLSGKARDAVLRAFTARDLRAGRRQRAAARAGVGLPGKDPGPAARLVATLPALEVPRPDWPAEAHVVGPLLWEPTAAVLEPPPGPDPLVLVSASTAAVGAQGLAEVARQALAPGPDARFRVVVTTLGGATRDEQGWFRVGPGRQDLLLRQASAVVGGGGHGVVAKALLAGVPVVAVPGGGDQWELSERVRRHGSGAVVRPLSAAALREAVLTVVRDPAYAARARAAAATLAAATDPVRVCRAAAGR